MDRKKDEQYKAKLEALGEQIKNILQETADKSQKNTYVTQLKFNGPGKDFKKDEEAKNKIQYGFGENDECCS